MFLHGSPYCTQPVNTKTLTHFCLFTPQHSVSDLKPKEPVSQSVLCSSAQVCAEKQGKQSCMFLAPGARVWCMNGVCVCLCVCSYEWGEQLEPKQDIVVHRGTDSSCGSLAPWVEDRVCSTPYVVTHTHTYTHTHTEFHSFPSDNWLNSQPAFLWRKQYYLTQWQFPEKRERSIKTEWKHQWVSYEVATMS